MARSTNSVKQRSSRYAQGGRTTVYPNRLGWWERTIYQRAYDDIKVVLTEKYNKRPDLLAYDLYGKSTYMWIILQFNHIIDINMEFVPGAIVYAPSLKRLTSSILINSGNTL